MALREDAMKHLGRASLSMLLLLIPTVGSGCATFIDWGHSEEDPFRLYGGTRYIAGHPGYMRDFYGCVEKSDLSKPRNAPVVAVLCLVAYVDVMLTMLFDTLLSPAACFYSGECYPLLFGGAEEEGGPTP